MDVIELALCEINHIIPRTNQLYRFVVMPGCAKCAELGQAKSAPAVENWKADMERDLAILAARVRHFRAKNDATALRVTNMLADMQDTLEYLTHSTTVASHPEPDCAPWFRCSVCGMEMRWLDRDSTSDPAVHRCDTCHAAGKDHELLPVLNAQHRV